MFIVVTSSIVAFPVYDMLSGIPLGLLHNEGHLDSQLSTTVSIQFTFIDLQCFLSFFFFLKTLGPVLMLH